MTGRALLLHQRQQAIPVTIDPQLHQPLVVADGGFLLVHAGLMPAWTPAMALALSGEVGAMLASERADDFLRELYGSRERVFEAAGG